jgi:hypothetical protein
MTQMVPDLFHPEVTGPVARITLLGFARNRLRSSSSGKIGTCGFRPEKVLIRSIRKLGAEKTGHRGNIPRGRAKEKT